MPPFQSVVRDDQTAGIVGEVSNEGPLRVQPWILDSSGSGETNLIGLVYTKVSDGKVTVGGTGAFIGIMVQPKEHALQGAAAGTLEPTLELQNEDNADFLDMGIMFVNLIEAGNVGDVLNYNTTTGVIGTGAAGGGELIIPNAKIIQDDIPGAGLGKIQLTN